MCLCTTGVNPWYHIGNTEQQKKANVKQKFSTSESKRNQNKSAKDKRD